MLARPEVDVSTDLVSIVTPPSTHAAFTIQALQAGKHVICEKPFALTAAEARDMQAAHEAACLKFNRPLIAIVDHELRFHSSVQAVKMFIHSGAFGSISHAHVTFLGAMQPIVQSEWSWWSDASEFGGLLGAIGSHMVDLLSYITSTEAVRVAANLRTIIAEKADEAGAMKAVTSDDTAEFRCTHRSDAASPRLSYRGSASHPQEFQSSTTLVGTAYGVSRNELLLLSDRGTILFDLATMQATFTPASRAHPKGEAATAATAQVWHTDAPAHVAHMVGAISPYVRGTVLLGQRLNKAIEEAAAAAVASSKHGSSSSSSSSHPHASLSALPPSLAGVAATFADGVYVQTVLDAARESNAAGGGWTDIVNKQEAQSKL